MRLIQRKNNLFTCISIFHISICIFHDSKAFGFKLNKFNRTCQIVETSIIQESLQSPFQSLCFDKKLRFQSPTPKPRFRLLKFSFSEKATKICAICLMFLTFTYIVNVKTIRQIAQIFVAFSEKLNFIEPLYNFLH